MVKAELVAKVAQEHGLKVTITQRAVDTMFSAMTRALVAGEGIEVRGFASFRVKRYEGYQGRNPRTGEPIKVSPKTGVIFKPGSELRRRVDGDA